MNYETYNKEKRRTRTKEIVLIVLIACLAVLTAVFVSLYAAAKSQAGAENGRYKTSLENSYRKSYYGLAYNADSLESAVSKLSVAKTKAMQQEFLSDISAYSTACAENLTGLVEEGSDNSGMLKFIHQTGDFAKYLDNKLSKGGSISEEERKTIGEIRTVVREIKSSLGAISEEVEKDGFSFLAAFRRRDGEFMNMVKTFENEDIDYPSMIYDGPFSDSMTEREAKALPREEVSEEEMREKLAVLLPNTEIAEISVQNGSKNVFETRNYELNTSRGKCYVTLAKRGAFPISVSFAERGKGETVLTSEAAEKAAEEYIRKIGFSSMKAVWASLYENVYYVNLAYTRNDVIYYPDLVKVQVSGETGEILGMESLNYVFNHTERPSFGVVIPPSEAVLSISEDLSVQSVRLALVPTKGNGETLAYEIFGTKENEKYFVYVGAESGEELKIMRVVDGERGVLLQ